MTSIIIDCDPGCDDAIAILLALQHTDVKAITTVCGNVGVEQTTANALMTVALEDSEIPVYAGACQPLEVEPIKDNLTHGSDGFGEIARLSHNRKSEPMSACDYLLNCVSEEDWVVALGPLTNLGEALTSDSAWGKRIGGISIMGGSTTIGNITPVAEFNTYADPHAAAAVYASGANLRICGLNVTHQLTIMDETVNHIRNLGTRRSEFTAALMNFSLNRMERVIGKRFAPLHDPCAVFALTHPSLFRFEQLAVQVEIESSLTRGMTVVDQRTTRPRIAPNALVAQSLNVTQALRILIATLESP